MLKRALATPAPVLKDYEKVITASGVKFYLHDLRRTFTTTAAELGIDGYLIKRLLNHRRNNDVKLGYIVYDIEALREPMQRIEDQILNRANKFLFNQLFVIVFCSNDIASRSMLVRIERIKF